VARKYGTKLVGGSSIGAGDGEVLTSRSPRRKGGFTVPGRPLAGGCAQDPGKPDGTVAPSPISVDRCLVAQLADPRLVSIRVGLDVQPLQGKNYTYSRVLGHGQPYSSVALIR
jgi:hypothetical protein